MLDACNEPHFDPGWSSRSTFGSVSLLQLDDAIVDNKIYQLRHSNDTGANKKAEIAAQITCEEDQIRCDLSNAGYNQQIAC